MTRPTRTIFAILSLMAVVGCGSAPPPDPWYPRALGPSAVPTNDGERAVLAKLDEISEDGEIRTGELTAYVEAPYHAASDRRCRRVRFASASRGQSVRTACESPDGWRLAADVFGSGEAR
jgi:hypothetical protein